MDIFEWFLENVFSYRFWFQPLFYSFHGWLATEMALWMLFHPYEPIYVPGTKLKLPFTPGIFPRGRHKLSVSIANTITDMLLTTDDIKKQAEKLVTEENIFLALDSLLDSIRKELKDINNLRRIYQSVDKLLPPLLQKLVNDYILELERGEDKHLRTVVNQFFVRILPHLRVNETQAEFLVNAIFTSLLTPDNLRKNFAKILTDANIAKADEAIRGRMGVIQGLLIRFLDLPKAFTQFRDFLNNEPEQANALMADILTQLEFKEKLTQQLMTFSPQQLPVETLEKLNTHLVDLLRQTLTEHREEISTMLSSLSEEATHSLTNHLLQMDFNEWTEAKLPGFKRDVARIIYTYLDKELENMLSKALPAISMNTVIVEKIDRFSARQLEETIQRICHRELRWLAFLGAFLGFWLGLVSNFVLFFMGEHR